MGEVHHGRSNLKHACSATGTSLHSRIYIIIQNDVDYASHNETRLNMTANEEASVRSKTMRWSLRRAALKSSRDKRPHFDGAIR